MFSEKLGSSVDEQLPKEPFPKGLSLAAFAAILTLLGSGCSKAPGELHGAQALYKSESAAEGTPPPPTPSELQSMNLEM